MGKSYAKIIDHPTLVRDLGNHAILNTDLSVVRKHQKRVQDFAKEQARTDEIISLKNELAELREMLQALTGGKK